jgi:pyrroloquinoline quinone biosynthesis protein B
VAVSADGARWFLVNASPDLQAQIERFPPLQPRGLRHSPIEGVLLTNADLDHTLGLFLLRGGEGVRIHASGEVARTLCNGLRMDDVMARYGGAQWIAAPESLEPLNLCDGQPSGLHYRALPLPANAPRYAPAAKDEGQSCAFELLDERTGGRLLIAPDVSELTPELRDAMATAGAVLFDGTFWKDDELQQIDAKARTASEMGHLPISSGSLPLLRSAPGRRIYLHINNTNPILMPGSPERVEVESAGVEIGEDGMEFTL